MDTMSVEERLCQAVYPPHGLWLCGGPATWVYVTVSGWPTFLCGRCVEDRVTLPWMKRRLTRLDTGEVTE